MTGCNHVAIVGLGLIGGSLARDLSARGVQVSAYDADASHLAAAVHDGIVDRPLDASLVARGGRRRRRHRRARRRGGGRPPLHREARVARRAHHRRRQHQGADRRRSERAGGRRPVRRLASDGRRSSLGMERVTQRTVRRRARLPVSDG